MSLIVVVTPDPKKPPCVVQSLAQSGLHVDAGTWCGKKHNASVGLFQVPAKIPTCDACKVAIQAYEAQIK